MKKYVIVALSVVLVVFFYACSHKPFVAIPAINTDTTTHNTTPDTTATNMTDTALCFERDVLPIFVGSCAMSGCHSASSSKSGYNLSLYAGIIAKGLVKGNCASSKIYTTCVSGKMPKSPIAKLNATQLSNIKRWIDKGAPNETNCPVICDTTQFTYTAAVVPIMSKYCYSCHATAAASSVGGGIILDTYNGIYTQAQNGKLLGDIRHSSGFNAMPLGGNKLVDCQITQICKWVTAGALNN